MKVDQKTSSTVALYRFFSATGVLLYVGISDDFPSRFKAHAKDKEWWTDVARIEIQRHPDREAASEAETEAVYTEHPRYNIHLRHGRMVNRSFRTQTKLWSEAKAVAAQRGENISDVIRDALERYVKRK